MALNITQLRERLRGMFGDAEDSARTVEALAAMTTGEQVSYRNEGNAATATAFVAQVVYTAVNKCRIVGARYVQSLSSTVSASDYYVVQLLKYASPTYSATALIAYLKGSTNATTANVGALATGVSLTQGHMTVNLPRASNAFALSSVSAEIELDKGDVLVVDVTRSGATGIGQGLPVGLLVLELG
jgi:hypothetical protein